MEAYARRTSTQRKSNGPQNKTTTKTKKNSQLKHMPKQIKNTKEQTTSTMHVT